MSKSQLQRADFAARRGHMATGARHTRSASAATARAAHAWAIALALSLPVAARAQGADPAEAAPAVAPPADPAPSEVPQPGAEPPPSAEPPRDAEAPPPPDPSPPPAPEPPPPIVIALPPVDVERARSPIEDLSRRGSVLVSVESALPLFAVGGVAPLFPLNALQIGETGNVRPWSLDLALLDRFTVGGSVSLAHTLTRDETRTGAFQQELASPPIGKLHYNVLGVRAGYVVPLSSSVGLWPRVGVSHAISPQTQETAATVDVPVLWAVTPGWGLTVGASARVPFAQSEAAGSDPGKRIALSVSAGLVAQLDPTARVDTTQVEEKWIFGVERLVQLLEYSATNITLGSSTSSTTSLDAGTIDLGGFRERSRLALHRRVTGALTLGGAASAGFTRSTATTDIVPSGRAPSTFELSLSPRAGLLVPITSFVDLWPRAGMTYASSSSQRPDVGEDLPAYHLAVDVEVYARVRLAHGVGLLFGPDLSAPLVGGSRLVVTGERVATGAKVRAIDLTYFYASLSAGIVVAL